MVGSRTKPAENDTCGDIRGSKEISFRNWDSSAADEKQALGGWIGIEPGRIFGLVGRNGDGKTTLIKCGRSAHT